MNCSSPSDSKHLACTAPQVTHQPTLLTMAGLQVRASTRVTRASSCWMRAGGGSLRMGSRQHSVDSCTPRSGHASASSSRDSSWTDPFYSFSSCQTLPSTGT